MELISQDRINELLKRFVTVPADVRQQVAAQTTASGKDLAAGFMSDWRVIAGLIGIGVVMLLAIRKR